MLLQHLLIPKHVYREKEPRREREREATVEMEFPERKQVTSSPPLLPFLRREKKERDLPGMAAVRRRSVLVWL